VVSALSRLARQSLFVLIPCPRHSQSLLVFFGSLLLILGFRHRDFKNQRLTFRYQRSLAAWQFGQQRQFQPLHDRLNASQMMAVNGNLVRGEDQLEMLFVAATGEFREMN